MAISKAERRRLKAARSQVLREQAVEAGMALPPPPPQVAKAKIPMPAKKDKKRKATGDVQSFAPRGKILATGSARAAQAQAVELVVEPHEVQIKGLPPQMSESALCQYFVNPAPQAVRLFREKQTAYLKFKSQWEADRCVEEWDGAWMSSGADEGCSVQVLPLNPTTAGAGADAAAAGRHRTAMIRGGDANAERKKDVWPVRFLRPTLLGCCCAP